MRKTTLGRELMTLNGNGMTLGHKFEKTSLGCELKALHGKKNDSGS